MHAHTRVCTRVCMRVPTHTPVDFLGLLSCYSPQTALSSCSFFQAPLPVRGWQALQVLWALQALWVSWVLWVHGHQITLCWVGPRAQR